MELSALPDRRLIGEIEFGRLRMVIGAGLKKYIWLASVLVGLVPIGASSQEAGKPDVDVYALMTGYIANAAIVREHFARHFGVDEARTCILRNGVDVDSLPFVEHGGAVTDIGIVGNMTRAVKRTDLFIMAAGIVALRHPAIRPRSGSSLPAPLRRFPRHCGRSPASPLSAPRSRRRPRRRPGRPHPACDRFPRPR